MFYDGNIPSNLNEEMFSSSENELSMNILPSLLTISKVVRALYGLELATLGFNNGQDEFLLTIDPEGTSVTVIANRLMVRQSSASKMIERLVERGLLEVMPKGADRRVVVVKLTPEGTEACQKLTSARIGVEARLRKVLSADAALPIDASLAHCATKLTKELSRSR